MIRQACWQLFKRDSTLYFVRQKDWQTSVIFFLLIGSLVPMTLEETRVLPEMGAALIWIWAVLSALLTLEASFREDLEDGSIEQLLLSPLPLPCLVVAKTCAHWLAYALPLCLASPILALFYHMEAGATARLVLSLLLGTPVLSLLGGMGVALTLGLARSGLLIALVVLPLYIPIVLLGCQLAEAQELVPLRAYLALLMSALIISAGVLPFATSAALRVARMRS